MRKSFFLLYSFVLMAAPLIAQKKDKAKPIAALAVQEDKSDSVFYSKVKYRSVGPYRGGRSAAVTGSYKNKTTFYFGSTGGGVWKTNDGGSNWKNISDKYFGGTIGSVAVAPSDETIVYVGQGENSLRGNVA